MQGAVPPVLDVDVGLLIQLADRGWRHLAAPERFGNVLHAPNGDAGKVHLNERFFYAALSAAIPFDDGRLEGNPLEARHIQCNVAGGRGKVSAVMAASVAQALLAALVLGGLSQLLGLSLQQTVQRFLYAATD